MIYTEWKERALSTEAIMTLSADKWINSSTPQPTQPSSTQLEITAIPVVASSRQLVPVKLDQVSLIDATNAAAAAAASGSAASHNHRVNNILSIQSHFLSQFTCCIDAKPLLCSQALHQSSLINIKS